MKTRRPKVVTTDFRTPGVKRGFPLEREFTRPGAAASPDAWSRREAKDQAEKAEHDMWVSTLSREACIGAAIYLSVRGTDDLPWQEKRWSKLRYAALRRRIVKEGWKP